MKTTIVVNLPVRDLAVSAAFYEALGFVRDGGCSDGSACSLSWRDGIWVMLWTREAYEPFARGRTVADARTTNAVIMSLAMDSGEAVHAFAATAEAHGGAAWRVGTDSPEAAMVCFAVADPDGHLWEPTWIAPSGG